MYSPLKWHVKTTYSTYGHESFAFVLAELALEAGAGEVSGHSLRGSEDFFDSFCVNIYTEMFCPYI